MSTEKEKAPVHEEQGLEQSTGRLTGAKHERYSKRTAVFALGAGSIFLLAMCAPRPVHGTISTAYNKAGAEHTLSKAVAPPTVERGFVMPLTLAGRAIATTSPTGYGRDEPIRKDGCTALDVCSTSRPPYALEQAAGEFFNATKGA
mgnify:CR=1 FL=1